MMILQLLLVAIAAELAAVIFFVRRPYLTKVAWTITPGINPGDRVAELKVAGDRKPGAPAAVTAWPYPLTRKEMITELYWQGRTAVGRLEGAAARVSSANEAAQEAIHSLRWLRDVALGEALVETEVAEPGADA
jgi:hypothetical protein